MADPSPTAAPEVTAQETTPLANGTTTAQTDIEMTDSAPTVEASEVRLSLLLPT